MTSSNQLTTCVWHQCCSGIAQHPQSCVQANKTMCHQRKGLHCSLSQWEVINIDLEIVWDPGLSLVRLLRIPPALTKIPLQWPLSAFYSSKKALKTVYQLQVHVRYKFHFLHKQSVRHFVECFFKVNYHSMCCLFCLCSLCQVMESAQSCVSRGHTLLKSQSSDVEEVIQFLVHIMEYNLFHHFIRNTGEWYGTVVIGRNFIYTLMHWGDIRQFPLSVKLPESIEAWNMCFKHKLEDMILTSTSKSGLWLLTGLEHFPFGKLFIRLISFCSHLC